MASNPANARPLCWHPDQGEYNPRRLVIEAHVELLLSLSRDTAKNAPDDWPTTLTPPQETLTHEQD